MFDILPALQLGYERSGIVPPRKNVKPKREKTQRWEKRVDETHYLSGRRRGAVLKEEVWYDGSTVMKYSLAYVNAKVFAGDNGRVLGYDNSHGHHHRHSKGNVQPFEFLGYEELVIRFEREVRALWRAEDEEED
jgi:hypothetical protein